MGEAAEVLDDPGGVPERAGCALWFTGLPGSGKSAIAGTLRDALAAQGLPVVWLRMDERRTSYFPHPSYTDQERDQAYEMFAAEAASLAQSGRIVLMDATAHKLAMRRAARGQIERFAEVYVRCPLAEAMRREAARPESLVMAGLYAKAIRRKMTGQAEPGLGQVIGVDTPFEEDPHAEAVVDSDQLTPTQARDLLLHRFAGWFGR
jgi:adenylylsulfate kinase